MSKNQDQHVTVEMRREPLIGDYFWVGVRRQRGAWIPARIIALPKKSANKKQYVVQEWGAPESDQRTVAVLGAFIPDIDSVNSTKTNDLVRLEVVDRKAIMWLLKNRLAEELIYTRVGDILVSVNPFKRVDIFRPEDMEHYQATPLTQTAPHPYEIMKRAYGDLMRAGRDQSLLISGESGAGKTFTVRVALAYLASVAGSPAKIEQKIMAGNPIFETFGNAKTQRNDNSSRFGKFAKIGVDRNTGNLVKCDTETYLLEKSRVAIRGDGERNFHIFYYITTLLNDEEKSKLHLTCASDFAYLGRGNTKAVYTTNPVLHNDKEEFAAMEDAFVNLGFTMDDRWNLYSSMAAILHLGNIEIESVEATGGSVVSTRSSDTIEKAAELLGISAAEEELKHGLTKNVKLINGKPTDFIYNRKKAIGARDALAKDIYGKVFDWLRVTLNEKMSGTSNSDMEYPAIGMLDIFGFEEFKNNSFEQLCINFANEKLQQIFNKHTFDLEAKTYQEEGIPYQVVEYADNQPLLDMLGLPKKKRAKQATIFRILDEKTNLESATDADFLSAIKRTFGKPGGGGPKKGKTALFDGFVRDNEAENPALCFKIRHYAGPVVYNADGFKEKNLDKLPDNLVAVMAKSTNPFVAMLYSDNAAGKRTGTQGQIFCSQLRALEASVDGTRTHFIRTVKPNEAKTPLKMDVMYSLTQLKFSGVFEAVGIKKRGYPFRETFMNFYREYWSLCPPKEADGFDVGPVQSDPSKYAAAVHAVLDGARIEGVYAGKTRVFYKAEQHRALEEALHRIQDKYALLIQKNFRRKHAILYVAEVRRQAENLKAALQSQDIETLENALAQFDAQCGSHSIGAEARPVFAARSKLKQLKLETTLLRKVEEYLLAIKQQRIADVYEDIISTLDEVDDVRRSDKQAFRGARWDILKDLRKEAQVFALRKELRTLRAELDQALQPIDALLSGAQAGIDIDFDAVKAECDQLQQAALRVENFALSRDEVNPYREEAMRQETQGMNPSSMWAPHLQRSQELRQVMEEQQIAVSRLDALIKAGDISCTAAAPSLSPEEALFDPQSKALRLASLRANIDAIHGALAPQATAKYPIVARQLSQAQDRANDYLPVRIALYRASLDDRVHHPAANDVYRELQSAVRACLARGIRSDDVRAAAEKVVVRRSVLNTLRNLRDAMQNVDLAALKAALSQADDLKLVFHPDSYVRLLVAQAIARERQLGQARRAIIDAFLACVQDIREEEEKSRHRVQDTLAQDGNGRDQTDNVGHTGHRSASKAGALRRFQKISRMAKFLGSMGRTLLIKGISGRKENKTAPTNVLASTTLRRMSRSGSISSKAVSAAAALATAKPPQSSGINQLRAAIRRAQVCGLPLEHYSKDDSADADASGDEDQIIGRAVRLFNNLQQLEAEAVNALKELDRDQMARVLVDCLQIGLEFPPHTDQIAALLQLPALEFEQKKLQALVKQKRWAPAIDLSMEMSLRILHANLRQATLARAKEAFQVANAKTKIQHSASESSGDKFDHPDAPSLRDASEMRLKEVTSADSIEYCDFRRYPRLTPPEVWCNTGGVAIPVEQLWLSAESVSVFSARPIHRPLVHVEVLDGENVSQYHFLAVENFSRILEFSGLAGTTDNTDLEGKERVATTLLTKILTLGIEKPAFREEIYCQLLKQLTSSRARGAPAVPSFVRDRTAVLLCCCLNSFGPPFALLDFVEYAVDCLSPTGTWNPGNVRSSSNPRHRLRRQLRFALHRTLTVGNLLSVPRGAVIRHALAAGEYLFDGPREFSKATVRVDYAQLYAGSSGLMSSAAAHSSHNLTDEKHADDSGDGALDGTASHADSSEARTAAPIEFNDQLYVAISAFTAETAEEMPLRVGDQVYLIGMDQLRSGDNVAAADYSDLLSGGWVAAMRKADPDSDEKESEGETSTKGLVPLSFLQPIDGDASAENDANTSMVEVTSKHTHCFAIKAYDGSRNAVDLPAAIGDIFSLVHDVPAMAGYVMVSVPVVDADDVDEDDDGERRRFGQIPADVLELIPPEVTHVAAFEYDAQAEDELTLIPGDLLIHQHWIPCDEGWVFLETLQGAQGIAPESYVSPLP